MRSSIIDESQQDYLTTGRAFGLRDKQVRTRHAVPNASLPTITLILLIPAVLAVDRLAGCAWLASCALAFSASSATSVAAVA